ncbi:MAG TPA: LOG family protein [Blastocatellia bacterium]|nr:LOG family protein [Blastocatellia bacterium]
MSTTDADDKTITVNLTDEEAVKQILTESVLGLWEVVNNLTRLRPTRRDRYRVTIFGSARAKPGSFVYEETKRVALGLTEMGCDIVTGGGPGLMQAANEGSKVAKGSGKSLGIRVDLPFEQSVNPFVELAFQHRTFFTRLHHFVLASDAFIVAPGGVGTVLETMMIWQLLQVRHLENTPLILVGRMWPGLIQWASSTMLSFEPPLANASDIDIPQLVANGDEAIAIIRDHHTKWQLERREQKNRQLEDIIAKHSA